MVAEQAKECSDRLQCTIYVIFYGSGKTKTLFQSQSKTLDKDEKILCAYNCGNEIAF